MDAAAYTLARADVDSLMQFLWFVSVAQIVVIALLALILGLVYGLILTKRWQA